MHNIELYLLSDEELVWEQTACLERLYDFNQTRPGEMEKRTAMLKEMFASNSVSLPRLDNPTGVCPTHRRQWADFLVSLMAPLHRQYKTARTETHCHLLLKTWQMAIQTSASRGYVLLRGAIRDTHKSPTNCLPGCGHDPRSAPNLERHGSSKMQTSGRLEMPYFLIRISSCIST